MKRALLVAALGSLCSLSFATVTYSVSMAGDDSLSINVDIPVKAAETSVQIPNWAPGSYRYQDFKARISNMQASNGSGQSVEVTHPDENTWVAKTPGMDRVRFSYNVPITMERSIGHYTGPSSYVYVVGRKEEDCRLEFSLPQNWRVALGLEPDGSDFAYVAPDYDVLADNPVTLGMFRYDEYEVDGVPHMIVYQSGPWAYVDRPKLVEICKEISESQAHFWGGMPFKRYIWHFRMTDSMDGAGGLEHLSSTEISLAIGLGERAVSVLSHELFHAWNVKRIRSKPLGPFNYLELPQTGALWWLEGVTDYYADLLLTRYGMYDDEYMYQNVIGNMNSTRRNEQRLQVSPYEASFRVREANNGRGNSQGYGVNYYNTGWVAGLCLDLEIRRRTGGARSLDDVSHMLWEMCREDQPGFPEDAIRKALIRVGGAGMGEVYDKWIMQPGELPVEEQLAKVGLEIAEEPQTTVTSGLTIVPGIFEAGARVARVSGPAEGKLERTDVVVQAGTYRFNGLESRMQGQQRLADFNASLKAGQPVTLKVLREGEMIEVSITPVSEQGTRTFIRPMSGDNAMLQELRRGWLYGKE